MSATLLLDVERWDLVADAAGNIAVASPPYATAQDAASQIRLFAGELYYDTAQGVPFFASVLGHLPPLELLRDRFTAAALGVPGARAARCTVAGFDGRRLSGVVEVTDSSGAVATAGF